MSEAAAVAATPGHDAPATPLTSLRVSSAAGGVAAAAEAAIVIPFLGRYGWDRDELYFLSAAHRPTWGYVDFPPVTAWIGWAVHALFGDSLDALRLTSLAAMLAATILVALMTRELGGGARTQAAAAFIWALSPYGLAAASIFHPTWFDALCWVALLYVLLLALRRNRPRLWLLAGAIAGIGLETKYTIAFLLAALLIALLVTTDGRKLLATKWPWLGLGVAVLLLAPNLVWEAQHGWASAHFISSQNAKTASDTPPATYVAQQFFLGAGVLVAVIGVVSLWRKPGLRPLALLPPLVTLIFLLERGRAYYPLPADSIAIAAGTIALAAWLSHAPTSKRIGVLAPLLLVQAAVLVYALPTVLPVRSTASMISSGVWQNSWYKDEIGWPELANQTAHAWNSLPARERSKGAILAQNYGEASALEFYGPSRGLPIVLSGHLSWQYWRPRALPQRFALLVGFGYGSVAQLCNSSQLLAAIDNHWHLDNEERGRTITACRLKHPLGQLWQQDIASNSL
jgi:4-amino-4-deoxy-L-arabinose transferase-like glycosyltransferase